MLADKKCKPCEGYGKPLQPSGIEPLLAQLHDWTVTDNKLRKLFLFVNFRHTMAFVGKVAELAKTEGHHPDMYVSYGYCEIILWTHAINGLSENDFILAAKIDQL